MKVFAYPYKGIAYNDGFYAALEKSELTLIEGVWSGSWIWSAMHRGDVMHIHWPSFLYSTDRSPLFQIVHIIRFVLLLLLVRLKGVRVYWTAHNLYPHDRNRMPWVDEFARQFVIFFADKVFVHGDEAKKVLQSEFPGCKDKCVVIPHGNWVGHYHSSLSRGLARKELNIHRDSYVYLVFGQCKPYKNIASLIKIFVNNAADQDVLLIAGSFSDKKYLEVITDLSSSDSRVRLFPEYIDDQDVSKFLVASDILCMPYRDILTSGTAMLAISYGLPVLSVNIGFLKDVITPIVGILVEPENGPELIRAMKKVKKIDYSRIAILKHAMNFTFEDAAEIFSKELHE